MTNNLIRKSQKHRCRCKKCRKWFIPDVRVGARQKHCSRKDCQAGRQRLNEQQWRSDPGNKKFLQAYKRRWREDHPEYMGQWRARHPGSVQRNREQTGKAVSARRQAELFEKTKEWSLQLARNKGVIYTNWDKTLIVARLKRQSRLSKALAAGYSSVRIRSGPVRLPQGRLYEISSVT